jgi:enoyl-CoA hydratase/carnithine racemase
MLTGDSLGAEEAYRLGMVSKIFPKAELAERTNEFARRIAAVPTMLHSSLDYMSPREFEEFWHNQEAA